MLFLIYNFYKIVLFSRCFFDSVILTFSFILPFHLFSNFCCVCKNFVKCFIHTHSRRLCKISEIFVTIENVFFYLNFTLTHLVFGFLIFVYIYIYIYVYIYIYILICVCVGVCMYVCIYVCMYVMYVCICVCMYVSMYVCIYIVAYFVAIVVGFYLQLLLSILRLMLLSFSFIEHLFSGLYTI